jgi:hypothetical protein
MPIGHEQWDILTLFGSHKQDPHFSGARQSSCGLWTPNSMKTGPKIAGKVISHPRPHFTRYIRPSGCMALSASCDATAAPPTGTAESGKCAGISGATATRDAVRAAAMPTEQTDRPCQRWASAAGARRSRPAASTARVPAPFNVQRDSQDWLGGVTPDHGAWITPPPPPLPPTGFQLH